MRSDYDTTEILRRGPATLDDPLYYLHNFRWVLAWVVARYHHLLDAAERQFVSDFQTLPESSQGLFVRMVMRKGQIFRQGKLNYAELGPTAEAAVSLLERGWIAIEPNLDIDSLFKLFTWGELRPVLAERVLQLPAEVKVPANWRGMRKSEALELLSALELEPRTVTAWGLGEHKVYHFSLMPLCDRFRLMFFGNCHQDWSEFVVTELGALEYETVKLDEESRPFHSREEIDAYLQLHACREGFYTGDSLDTIATAIPALPSANPWLLRLRDRIIFQIAREWERAGELGKASLLYQDCHHPEARSRLVRVLECGGEFELALALAQQALETPVNEAERQQLHRSLPRLERKLGLPRSVPKPMKVQTPLLDLTLPLAASVELAVAEHLSSAETPVFYVENTLIAGLFGLLCWEAIFAPLPGAFFHPFQRGPADLHWPDFYQRRKPLFDRCLASLTDGRYRYRITQTFNEKQGRQSPFVYWDYMTTDLINYALECIPARHLQLIFERMLRDIKANRAGFPDLIQFWPDQCAYQMIEVKGPGDRVQDNQQRWLDYFALHQIPVAVCHVRWSNPADNDGGIAADVAGGEL